MTVPLNWNRSSRPRPSEENFTRAEFDERTVESLRFAHLISMATLYRSNLEVLHFVSRLQRNGSVRTSLGLLVYTLFYADELIGEWRLNNNNNNNNISSCFFS